MAKIPTYEEMGKKVAEAALNEIYGGKTIREWIEILVKQKPWDGEDCISRQSLLNRLDDFNKWCKDGRLQGSLFAIDVIKDMPPVTPQPKIGEWINDSCSECGKGIEDLISSPEWYRNERPNFCPFCGIPIRK